MKTIVLATGNKDKAREIKAMLDHKFEVKSMKDMGIDIEIIEDGDTFEDNALIKVRAIQPFVKDSEMIIMGDDSGLSVDALDGAPGIYSARYAGEDVTYRDNNEKLLKAMKDVPEEKRGAEFVSAIAMILPDGQELTVRGTVRGRIAFDFMGEEGFGYDPLFIVEETSKSYAQMAPEEKNDISHRARAVARAKQILEKYQ
ncbi:XTP/dITP diphosphatase [Eubacterium sp. AM05-23]|uniref:XTP/dITP diphosphatase n=1 Tax=Eubacterium TaxID=1730 RepID=UPI000E5099FA|nr:MULTISPECIES: XTP/dITP diphosphatase [Eubacterium]RHO57957.1 XTP/dITP diphosphatase [Eubacterium sp. AM05-23]